MEVRKDFGKRMTALAAGVPRETMAMLLKKLLPREPVAVRAPEGGWKFDAPTSQAQPRGFSGLGRRKRATRGRSSYEVVNSLAHLNHRRGTWRAAMVEAVVSNTNERDAVLWLTENYPHFADKGVSLAWCREVGYIQ